jgi:hypothetical protein
MSFAWFYTKDKESAIKSHAKYLTAISKHESIGISHESAPICLAGFSFISLDREYYLSIQTFKEFNIDIINKFIEQVAIVNIIQETEIEKKGYIDSEKQSPYFLYKNPHSYGSTIPRIEANTTVKALLLKLEAKSSVVDSLKPYLYYLMYCLLRSFSLDEHYDYGGGGNIIECAEKKLKTIFTNEHFVDDILDCFNKTYASTNHCFYSRKLTKGELLKIFNKNTWSKKNSRFIKEIVPPERSRQTKIIDCILNRNE